MPYVSIGTKHILKTCSFQPVGMLVWDQNLWSCLYPDLPLLILAVMSLDMSPLGVSMTPKYLAWVLTCTLVGGAVKLPVESVGW